jgi:protoheme IX farnesyltransferase
MFLAAGGYPGGWPLLLAAVGGFLISGSASVFNCIYDRDIDAVMQRTRQRPIAAGRLDVDAAAMFGGLIGILGFVILWLGLNPVAAIVALIGHLFYVFVYTIWLKRTSPQNIVIGGAAGAFPPLVGWAAVTGSVNLTALLLFLVIFLWTPPHFWALALVKNEDYKRAKVPMMPVVAGAALTVNQMLFYAILLVPCTIAIIFTSEHLSWFSLVSFVLLGVVFVQKILRLRKAVPIATCPEDSHPASWKVFTFSMIYLAGFFFVIVLDSFI